MRLRSIYVLCRDNLGIIDDLNGTTVSNNTAYTQVSNWSNVANIINNKLLSIKYLEEYATDLIQSIPEIYRAQDSFKVKNAEWNNISNAKRLLRDSMIDVINLYESMGLDSEESTGIDIQLPKCNDFSDFKKYIDELDFILYKCPFFVSKEEALKFETVDVGSMWLSFVIVGTGIVTTSILANNIAAFIDKCLIIRSHKKTIEEQEISLKAMEMDNSLRETTIKGLKKLYEAQVNILINELESETGIKLKDGEERGRVIQTIEKMNGLLDKGLQIYSALDSPDEVKSLFEPIEMKYLSMAENIKLLDNKDNDI